MGGHYVDPDLDAANRERQRLVAHGARLGDSSSAIASAAGVTRQRVCQIIGELGLHDVWVAARAQRTAQAHLEHIMRRWRPERRTLMHEAQSLGYHVAPIRGSRIGVEGCEVHLSIPGPPWVSEVRHYRPTHPGYYRWAPTVLHAVYVVLFDTGGRLFALPPHQKGMRYVRADEPAVTTRGVWPSREALRQIAAMSAQDRVGERAA